MKAETEKAPTLKTSIYIAASLDGFIAMLDHGLGWLAIVKAEGEDYGYAKFMASVDCLLIGRNTYDVVCGFGEWPYAGKKVFVLTHRPFKPIADERQVSGSLAMILQDLKKMGLQHVYLDGGVAARAGLNEGVVTDITVSVIPVLLGAGIPLFGSLGRQVWLQNPRAKLFNSGLVQLSYQIPEAS
jgi:dihydrofolate reductase